VLCALELYFATRRFERELPICAKVVMIALADVSRKSLFASGYLLALPRAILQQGAILQQSGTRRWYLRGLKRDAGGVDVEEGGNATLAIAEKARK
jgi:hypothetical protein